MVVLDVCDLPSGVGKDMRDPLLVLWFVAESWVLSMGCTAEYQDKGRVSI
jgi:hypothetical protein